MKTRFRIPTILATCAGLAAVAAAGWVYNATLVNNPALAYNQNFTINMNTTPNANGIKRMSAQAVYSSATLPTDTFMDGRVSTATITINSTGGLLAAPATNQITVAATSVIVSSAASDSLVVKSTSGLTGQSLTINGTVLPSSAWRKDTTTHTATDIAAQINTYINQVTATVLVSSVIVVANNAGAVGNSYTMSSSTPSAITVASASFSGGQDPAFRNQSLTVNGVVYPRGYYWNFPNTGPETSSGTATSIAALLNTISGIKANAVGSVVYATATVSGTAGNGFTMVSSTPSAMTIATPSFSGGLDNASIAINGVSVTVSTGASTSAIATSLASAINANSNLSPIVKASAASNVVYSTSTSVGIASNYTLTSSSPALVSVSHPTYVGGQNASFTINSPVIAIPSHGYQTGVALLLTGSNPPAPLTTATTYYAIALDASDIELATTSANAQTGTFITLTSSSTTGPHTTTLTPLAYSGTAGLAWYGSIDCANWNPVNVSSVTISSPSGVASSLWDFGTINYKCLQLQVAGPSTGGLNLVVTVNGKD